MFETVKSEPMPKFRNDHLCEESALIISRPHVQDSIRGVQIKEVFVSDELNKLSLMSKKDCIHAKHN